MWYATKSLQVHARCLSTILCKPHQIEPCCKYSYYGTISSCLIKHRHYQLFSRIQHSRLGCEPKTFKCTCAFPCCTITCVNEVGVVLHFACVFSSEPVQYYGVCQDDMHAITAVQPGGERGAGYVIA